MTTPSSSASERILFVDDDPNLLDGLRRSLRRTFTFDTALGGAEALAMLEKGGPYAVVVADMRMPLMDGIELLQNVRRLYPDTARIMLTGNADQQTAADAVNRGQILRFLNKPCPPELLEEAVRGGLAHHAALRRERELIEGTVAGCIELMTEVLAAVAPEAVGEGQRLRESAVVVARALGLEPAWEIELAARLCRLGFATLPPSLLRKLAAAGELTPLEHDVVEASARVGHDLLAHIPRLDGVARAVLYQRQRFDGGGFPSDGVAGAAIPVGARLLRILQDRLALELEGVARQAALAVMRGRAGAYDPELLHACFECLPGYLVQSIAADRPVRSLAVAELKPGQIVVSDVSDADDIVLVGAGHRLTRTMIERLRAHQEIGRWRGRVLVQDAETAGAPL